MAAKPNLFVSFYKIFRWVVLAALILFVVMVLRRPARPSLPMTPQETKEQADSFNQKMNELPAERARKSISPPMRYRQPSRSNWPKQLPDQPPEQHRRRTIRNLQT